MTEDEAKAEFRKHMTAGDDLFAKLVEEQGSDEAAATLLLHAVIMSIARKASSRIHAEIVIAAAMQVASTALSLHFKEREEAAAPK